jgi:hypothetical protein
MTGGLQRPTKGTIVKQKQGKFVVTDGPFAETKEVIDGFALVNAKSREEAIEIARRFMKVAGDGEGEILSCTTRALRRRESKAELLTEVDRAGAP